MAEKVHGSNAMIKFNFHASMEAYCWAKSFDMNIDTDMIPCSTLGSQGMKNFIGKRNGFSLSMEALVLLTDLTPKNITPDFVEAQLNLMAFPFEIFFTGEDGGLYSMSGRALVQNLSFKATPNAYVSKNVQMQGTGGLLRGTTPISMITLHIEVVASPGAVSMSNIKIVDAIGNETIVHAGTIANGTSVDATIQAGTYHIRATLNSDRPYNLFYSDADPGFNEHLDGAQSGTVYWPYPPNLPVWDFSTNRFLKWQGSNTPIS